MIFIQVLICSLILSSCASDVVINPLAGISDNNLVYSGTLPVSETSSDNLFFTFYGKSGEKDENNLQNYPLLIFVGNPGTSAQFINLAAVGPMRLKNDMTLSTNANTPAAYANIMFVDLLGSGFSFASAEVPNNTKAYGLQLTYAINKFKEATIGKSKSIIILGEGTFVRAASGIDDIDGLKSFVHISLWPELYAVGKYAGTAGIDMAIFTNSQKVAIQSTFVTCYNDLLKKKYSDARICYDSVMNFVELRTKNRNLFNTALISNLTESLPMIQYYFSQASTVAKYKAPSGKLFHSQSNKVANRTFVDQALNYTSNLSQFTKDFLDIKHLFITTSNDYVCYRKAIRNWLQNQLSFVESAAFKQKALQDLVIDEKVVGYTKEVKQIYYLQINNAGHYVFQDQNQLMNKLLKTWVDSMDPGSNLRQVEGIEVLRTQ